MPRKIVVAHVIHHLHTGGLENGLINLINGLPEARYEHSIVCIDDFSESLAGRIRPAVRLEALHKPPGNPPHYFANLYRLLQRTQPTILHSRNLAGLDSLLPARLAGIRVRIHGEHGWDVNDLDGLARKPRWLRRLHRPLVSHYVALSKHLEHYLTSQIGVPEARVTQIYNGVDLRRFAASSAPESSWPGDFGAAGCVTIGAVGRLQPVKNYALLLSAFHRLRQHPVAELQRSRLVIVGGGPEEARLRAQAESLGLSDVVRFTGETNDVPTLLNAIDVFVQPSLAEGISNTILEAMACARPVVATAVGGNPELVHDDVTGLIVPSNDTDAMATALQRYCTDASLRHRHGEAGRERALATFSQDSMIDAYDRLYQRFVRQGDSA